MLNVLHIISDTNIGGAGRHLLTFLENFDRARIKVWVLCPPGSLLVERCAAAGVETYTSPYFAGDKSFGWRGLMGLLREVGGIIKRHKIDIVHTHATFSGRLAAMIAGARGVVYTKHRMDWEASRGGLKNRAVSFLNRSTCHRVIAVSHAVRESLLKEGMPEERIKVIYNGINVKRFRENALKENPKAQLKIDKDRVVGMVARLEPEKGHRYFLEAAAMVLEDRKDVSFVVVGTGSLKDELVEMAERLGISDRVIFTGLRGDIPQCIAIMDVVVIPSLTEAFGITMIEAMCLGKACVASAVGGLVEIAGEDGHAAFLVPPGDARAIAGKILFLLKNPDTAMDMGSRAAAEVERRFEARIMADSITDLYNEMMSPV